MASEHPGERSVSLDLPESLSGWLDDKAAQENLSREEVLLQLMSAYRQLDGNPDGAVTADGEVTVEEVAPSMESLVAELRGDIESVVDERLEDHEADRGNIETVVESYLEDHLAEYLDGETGRGAVGEDLDQLESRFMELLQDVRERVVQVKREADSKAPASHDHPELPAEEDLERFEQELSDLAETVGSVDARLSDGFENFEAVLEYLTESIDELAARQTTLARALVETRQELRTFGARDSARSAAEDLQRSANRRGIEKATCDECNTPVNIGLLSRAECPHCSSTFVDVEPARGFFGSSTLETGSQPALEPTEEIQEEESFEYQVDEIIDAESPAATGVPEDSGSPDGESEE